MAVLFGDVRGLSVTGEFDDPPFSDAFITARITEAERVVASDLWGELADEATMYLVAHRLVMAKTSGDASPAAPIQSMRAGQLSQTRATIIANLDDGDLNSTRYGRHYLFLRNGLPLTPMTTFTDEPGID